MLKFVQRENIARFVGAFQGELGPEERDRLRQLLLEEEARYGFHAEQLEITERHIRDSRLRIAKQAEIVGRVEAAGKDASNARRLMDNLVTMLSCFEMFQANIVRSLDRQHP